MWIRCTDEIDCWVDDFLKTFCQDLIRSIHLPSNAWKEMKWHGTSRPSGVMGWTIKQMNWNKSYLTTRWRGNQVAGEWIISYLQYYLLFLFLFFSILYIKSSPRKQKDFVNRLLIFLSPTEPTERRLFLSAPLKGPMLYLFKQKVLRWKGAEISMDPLLLMGLSEFCQVYFKIGTIIFSISDL